MEHFYCPGCRSPQVYRGHCHFFLDLSSLPPEKLRFAHVNERNVDPLALEAYRTQAAEDLTLFLRLRAEELADGGFGLYLMVADMSEGRSNSNFLRREG